jgi:Leucine-rich repeat (LRR) protein
MAVLNSALVASHLSSLTGGQQQSIDKVTQLKLVDKSIRQIGDMKACRSLRRLDLTNNQLTGAIGNGLASAPTIDYLILNENKLTSLEGVQGCPRIKVLIYPART